MVVLNSDDWLQRKKGYVFMPWKERAYIMGNIKGVAIVTAVDDSDGSVCEALKRHKPAYFANGGDRANHEIPEAKVCRENGIEIIDGLGDKIRSSSDYTGLK